MGARTKWVRRCVWLMGLASTGLFASSLAHQHHPNGLLESVMNSIEEMRKPNSILPQNFLTTQSLITHQGFGYQKYKVQTEDGYILTAHRILSDNPGGPPVILQHGLIAASDNLVVQGRNACIAFLLADAGFDVWLTDQRGNWYSREHVKYKPSDPKFWDFSFHEAGYYDLPAFIDTVLQITGYTQVFYIGHSMGTTVFMVMASLRPEYNQKIKAAALLAPIALPPKMQEINSPVIRLLLLQAGLIYATSNKFGLHELLPRTAQNIMAIRKLCDPSPTQEFCLDLIGIVYGENRENLDRQVFGTKVSYLPAGSSLRTAHHLAQIYTHGFRHYDYGAKDNLRRYRSEQPPHYPLTNITAPVALYWGANDLLLNGRTVRELGQSLPNLIKSFEVADPKFTHMDFIFGLNAAEVLYKDIVYLFQSLL
ncbi:lipase 3-like [Rhodnius prolixus]|uniref:lipase 3-like n=1 Tax=Rhodnius prolixus TaxID=13249 RepID=UPI003D18CC0B